MHRKVEAALLAALLAVGLISGCGSKVAENSNVTDDSAADEGALPSGDVNLRVWGAEEDAELVGSIISGFISEHQGQANLKITFEPHSEANCKDDLLSDVLNAPDVFTFADDQLMAFVASGVLKKVSNDSEISGRNLAAASEAASVNGALYAYPLTADNGYFLFYNKKVLSDEDVQTMDGLLAAAKAAGGQVFMEMTSGWYMYSFFGNTDMEIGLNDDGISTYCNWNAKYTNIKGVDVAEAMLKIGTDPAFCSSAENGFVGGAADGTFVAGVSGIWDENSIKEAWGDDYAATKLPTYTVAGQQLQMSSYAGYKLVGVNSYSPNAAWAAEFADYMTNEKNQTLRFTMRGQGPSNKNASASGDVAQSKAIQALQQQAEFSSLQRVGGTYWDAATAFGTAMVEGNPSGKELQVLLNEMVLGITGEETTGDPEGAETAEEVAEETTEEASEETTEEVTEETAEEVAEETTAETAEDVTEEATEETTEADAEAVSEETTDEAAEETTEAVNEEKVENTTTESSEETAEKSSTEEKVEVNSEKSNQNVENSATDDKSKDKSEKEAESEDSKEMATDEKSEEAPAEEKVEIETEKTNQNVEKATSEVATEKTNQDVASADSSDNSENKSENDADTEDTKEESIEEKNEESVEEAKQEDLKENKEITTKKTKSARPANYLVQVIKEKLDTFFKNSSGTDESDKQTDDVNAPTNNSENTEDNQQTDDANTSSKSNHQNEGPAGINEKEEETKEGTIITFEGLGKAAKYQASIGG